jgi:hypothetical protein
MRRIVSVVAAALLLGALVGPAAGAATASTWHRDNYGNGHERLICTTTSGVWQCRYDTMPNYPAGFIGNGIGEFTGSAADDAWCPDWAPAVCGHVQGYVVGATVYGRSQPVTIWEELIFTDGDGVAPMYMYLVGPGYPAVCPWYQTWDEALANDYECDFPS